MTIIHRKLLLPAFVVASFNIAYSGLSRSLRLSHLRLALLNLLRSYNERRFNKENKAHRFFRIFRNDLVLLKPAI